jgi:hypothetical protein
MAEFSAATGQLLRLRAGRMALRQCLCVGQQHFGVIGIDQGDPGAERGSRIGQRELPDTGEGFLVVHA